MNFPFRLARCTLYPSSTDPFALSHSLLYCVYHCFPRAGFSSFLPLPVSVLSAVCSFLALARSFSHFRRCVRLGLVIGQRVSRQLRDNIERSKTLIAVRAAPKLVCFSSSCGEIRRRRGGGGGGSKIWGSESFSRPYPPRTLTRKRAPRCYQRLCVCVLFSD